MARWKLRLYTVGLLALASTPAHAGDAEAAEHVRLSEELAQVMARNAWTGAEDVYQALVVLEAGGEALTGDEVYRGAQVAQANGDIAACRARLERAQVLAPTLEMAVWLRAIDTAYGPVALRARTPDAATLLPETPPFEPDRRAAISAAQAQLARGGRFDGLLPRGAYTFGGVRFAVDPQVAVVTVDLAQPAPAAPAVALVADPGSPVEARSSTRRLAVAPRLSVGAAYTAGLAPTLDDAAQPPAFGGAGARIAAGVELSVTPALRLWAEGGYQGLVAPGGGARPDALHLGFVSAGPALSAGRVRVAVGGVMGAGALQATGIDDLAGLDAACPAGSDDPDCAWITGVPEAARPDYVWTGTVVTPGVEGSVSARLVPLGHTLMLGVAVGGGALFDPSRAWPFAQVGIEIGPG
jgi:hypothetical protein